MHYSVLGVGYEFMIAEEFRKNGDMENAKIHYRLALDHYEKADDEYMLDPDSQYEEIISGETISYPSVSEMVGICHEQLNDNEHVSVWKIILKHPVISILILVALPLILIYLFVIYVLEKRR